MHYASFIYTKLHAYALSLINKHYASNICFKLHIYAFVRKYALGNLGFINVFTNLLIILF